MISSFEAYGPIVKRILPLDTSKGVCIERVTVDIGHVGVKGEVKIYLVDANSNRVQVFRKSSGEFGGNVSTEVDIEGWKGAWVEVIVNGFFNVFASIKYEHINEPMALNEVVESKSLVLLYKQKTKTKEVKWAKRN